MGKIFSISKLTSFLRYCFGKSSVKIKPAADNVVPFVRRTSDKSEQIVSSNQIVAYNKRYGRLTKPVQNPEPPKTEVVIKTDEKLQAQAIAHDRAKLIEVSPEALKNLEHDFDKKKNKVQQLILADSDLIPKEFIKAVKEIKTPEELAFIIRTYPNLANFHLDSKHSETVQKFLKTNVISLNAQQDLFRDETRICDVSLELIKAVTEPSTDAKVVAVENYLKTRYDMDFVHLESMEEANRILRTVMLAKKHKIPLPKNIIISPYVMVSTSGASYVHSSDSFSVVLKSAKEEKTMREFALSKLTAPEFKDEIQRLRNEYQTFFSTDDELQRYVHEFVHTRQFMELLLPHKLNPVPKKFENAINNLGEYARTSRRELDAELKTKQILRSLNDDEKELLDYLE